MIVGRGQREKNQLLGSLLEKIESSIAGEAVTANGSVYRMSSENVMVRGTDIGVVHPKYLNIYSVLLETEHINCLAGYRALRDEAWIDGMGHAVAQGMFSFARELYGNHAYLKDEILIEVAEAAARKIDELMNSESW